LCVKRIIMEGGTVDRGRVTKILDREQGPRVRGLEVPRGGYHAVKGRFSLEQGEGKTQAKMVATSGETPGFRGKR